ncbi:MAG: ABC transporter permease, partial [Chloroflexota bacterium]
MAQTLRFTLMLLRAYVRDRTALFFSLLLPLLLMVIFGFLNFGSFGRVDLGVVVDATSADSERFIAALSQVRTLRVVRVSEAEATRRLRRSELDLALVLPSDFRIVPARAGASVPRVRLYENEASPQEAAVGAAIITETINRISFAVSPLRRSAVMNDA